MPIIIPQKLPAYRILTKENIFIMSRMRAASQDIRPIEIAVLNLMPVKETTETHLLRLLSNTPLQVNITFINTETYLGTNTAESHLSEFYKGFSEIKGKYFDGMVITGAPVEKLEFEDVKYWKELTEIFEYTKTHVTSTIFICWGAQAALNYFYGIPKHELTEKLFGVFKNRAVAEYEPLLKGMNDRFSIPHSRYTTVKEEDVLACDALQVLAKGRECGLSIVKSVDNRQFFFFGHSEYDRDTLENEYLRDKAKGLGTKPPLHYYLEENPAEIEFSWNSTGNLLFYNWLNHYVYQVTPFKLPK